MTQPKLIRDAVTMIGLLSRRKVTETASAKLELLLRTLEERSDDETVKGSLTLKFEFTRKGVNLGVQPSIEVKLPKEKGFGETQFFLVDGAISLEHPSQTDMFPRNMETDRGAGRA